MQERRQAAEGTTTVIYFIKLESLETKELELEITKRTIPHANLSKREYIPNTIAPFLLLAPITSDIILIPVDKVNVCAVPTTRAIM